MEQKTCAEIITEAEEEIKNSPVLKAACEYSDSVKRPTTIYGFRKVDLIEAFEAGAEWKLQHLGHPDPPGEQGVDGTTIIKEVIKEKAIEAFNEAMIFYTSAACPSEQEALKYFRCVLDQELDSGCSEKPNNQKTFTGKICGNCDAFCECALGTDGAKHDDVACPGFEDSSLKQLK